MRGKLRDKRSSSKHDLFKHSENEQRRPYKRDSRTMDWSSQQVDDDDNYNDVEDEQLDADEEEAQSNTSDSK